jgi:hypothetical protein
MMSRVVPTNIILATKYPGPHLMGGLGQGSISHLRLLLCRCADQIEAAAAAELPRRVDCVLLVWLGCVDLHVQTYIQQAGERAEAAFDASDPPASIALCPCTCPWSRCAGTYGAYCSFASVCQELLVFTQCMHNLTLKHPHPGNHTQSS